MTPAHEMRLVREGYTALRAACVCTWQSTVTVTASHPAADAALLAQFDAHVARP